MTRRPTTLADVGTDRVRAGGTDLVERAHKGLVTGPFVDLGAIPELHAIESLPEGGLAVGAGVTLAALAADPRVVQGWSGVSKAADALATPEIRNVATLGGNLAQHTRCWYYRNALFPCLKKGGGTCYAREGDHSFHAIFDLSPSAAVHASTMACALLTQEAAIEVVGPPRPGWEARYTPLTEGVGWTLLTVEELLGDGADPRRHNALADGELISRVHLLPQGAGEKTAYLRATSRARAEWPIIEVSVRLTAAGARVAVGAVAAVPLRLSGVEAALDSGETPEKAATRAGEGARPLPGTRYKLDVLPGLVRAAVEMAS